MEELFLYFLAGIMVGACLFYFGLKFMIGHAISKLHKELDTLDEVAEAIDKIILARVELHNNQYYVYNNETDEFIAQGTSLKELRERIKDRWSEYKISVVAGDDLAIDQLQKQLNENSNSI